MLGSSPTWVTIKKKGVRIMDDYYYNCVNYFYKVNIMHSYTVGVAGQSVKLLSSDSDGSTPSLCTHR